MTRRMRLLFLVAILVIMAGVNMVSQSINSVTGSDYPGVIRYDTTGMEAQLTILGRDYPCIWQNKSDPLLILMTLQK